MSRDFVAPSRKDAIRCATLSEVWPPSVRK
jgi:hypothetical protein